MTKTVCFVAKTLISLAVSIRSSAAGPLGPVLSTQTPGVALSSAGGESAAPVFSGDGRYLFFQSLARDLA